MMKTMIKQDCYQQLVNGDKALAVLGLNMESFNFSQNLAHRFEVIAADPLVEESFCFRVSPNGEGEAKKAGLDLLQNAAVFYITGTSDFIANWQEIKAFARVAATNLQKGNWIIFGNDIDPDMVEVVLLPLIEQVSGLRMGLDFEIAFDPRKLEEFSLRHIGYEAKISHNLIVDKVAKILDAQENGFKSFQLNFLDEDRQLAIIREAIKDAWLPVMNGMTNEMFEDFTEACYSKHFLDSYKNLRLTNEYRVDPFRFFQIASEEGLRHDFVNKLTIRALAS